MIRPLLIFCLFISADFLLFAQDDNIFSRWHDTDLRIRDRKISSDAAIDSIMIYVPQAVEQCKKNKIKFTKTNEWVFPLSGWSSISYRSNGNDYRDEDFDYFQGGESKGHPAHDIFINDADSNALDDSTHKKVDAVAVVSGVIISMYSGWKEGGFLRSGNYVKLFDPMSRSIFYYSHLDSVAVNVGQFVREGEKIGTVGRTGRKAVKGRTHLHIACYLIEDGYPVPADIIENLRKAERRY